MNNAHKRIVSLTLVLIMLIMLLSTLVIAACGHGSGNISPNNTLCPSETPDISTTPCPSWQPDASASPEPQKTRHSTLYYRTDEGYIYPMSVDIPMVDGIAKACLSRLISTSETRAELQKLGLNPVIPEGTQIELNISGGAASVNLKGLPALASREEEEAMFSAIVNTLLEFQTIDSVTIYIDGEDRDTAGHGSLIPKSQISTILNPEMYELSTSGNAKPMLLYFPNESGSLYIPVTRYVEGNVDLYSSIKALADGTTLKGLRSCFPENTLVLGATIETGILTVNLSADFEAIADQPGLFDLACNTVLLTAQQFGSVDEVRFMVNGTPFEP